MTTPHTPDLHTPELTDELLSAYIDNAVTPAERELVERAVAADPAVAWRLQSLQMTVQLLHELPALALPRSFVLTPEAVGEVAANTPAPVTAPPRRTAPAAQPGFWTRLGEGWRAFWSSGSPVLRNAMATSLVLLFVFLAAPRMLTAPFGTVSETQLAAPGAAPLPESMAESAAAGAEASAPAAASAQEDGAPSTASDVDTQSADQAIPLAQPAASDAMAAKGTAPADDAATEAAPAEVALAAAPAAAAPPVTDAVEVEALAFAAAPSETVRPVAAEAAPLALSVVPAADPAQNADPLAAARAVVPPAGESGSGPAAAAMAAPAGAAAPLPTPLPPATVAPTATSAPTQTPTTLPTAAPTATPTALPTTLPAPTAAGVAREQAAPAARIVPAAPAPAQPEPLPWLTIAQIVAAAGCLLFGLLWWRSRR